MTVNPPCPLCQNRSSPLFYAGEHRMFRCESCHLAFVYPTPSEDYLRQFYSTFHLTQSNGGTYDTVEERMKEDFPTKIIKISKFTKTKSIRLIDIGCGKGFFVQACATQSIDAIGIDLSDTAIDYAKNNLNVNAICGTIKQHAPEIGQFDVATFWATIEHIPNTVETLQDIALVLKKGGLLFLDTGIGNDWLDRLLPGVNQWYDPPQHLYVFSRQALSIALDRAGFVIEHIDCNYERSYIRRLAKTGRALLAATSLRIAAEASRCAPKSNSFSFTRYPLGNLMSIVAKKK